MYKCKSCGGDLVLNIARQELKCPYCDSVFPVSDYEDAQEIKGQDTYETTIYTCSQCGAEIATTDSTAVTFCSYCGTEANLQGRLAREKRPKYIIPFKQTKEQCKVIYSENVKKQPYAPKEFTSPEYLENFRGIYIPYWEINVGFDKNPELKVTEKYTSGEYDYTDEYTANPKIAGTKIPIPQDASASFDDEIAAQIAPFNKEDMKDFNPAYLAGFFADTADVDADVYSEKAMVMAEDHVIKNVELAFRAGAKVDLSKDQKVRTDTFGSRIEESHLNLFPVWFLTWRKGDRLAYGVINGETGKISADIPIDTGSFLRTSAIIALVLFIISCVASVLVLPATVLMISSIAALLVHYLYRQEIISLAERESHANDLGALSGEALEEAKQSIGKRKATKSGTIGIMVKFFVVALISMTIVSGTSGNGRSVIVCLAVCIIGIVLQLKAGKYLSKLQEKSMKTIFLLPFMAEIIALIIAFIGTVHDWDWIYYTGSIIAFAVTAIVSINMIKQYNLLTTRPIPEFHNREGGNKDVGA
ncbi:MAG: hypothetical protein IJT96_05055 [Lachnospiraceae bacterium]|nr:hypothetical protein [Lachnospiraceae bacterium]